MMESQNQKKNKRHRSFHFRYLELCRLKNYPPLPDVRAKNNNTAFLEFFGDKLKIEDWLLIIDSLYIDTTLQSLGIRLRKTFDNVAEHIDSERKARIFKSRPVIFTKFILTGAIEAISNCIACNKNLKYLALEGLPINENYIVYIAKALSSNNTLQSISFFRSSLGDKACEAICSTIKHLSNIEYLNLSHCGLTTSGAISVANMIKFQKIYRYSEGWINSLRYRDVDPNSIPGLKEIIMNHNPDVKDDGLIAIVEVLKEDAWIKVVEMENCGITDVGAAHILQCFEYNNTLQVLNVTNNTSLSDQMLKDLMQRNKENECAQETKGLNNSKSNILKIREKLKFLEEQIAVEVFRRKQMENLNEHLHEQILNYQKQLLERQNFETPEGFILIEGKSFEKMRKERDNFRKALSTAKLSKLKTHSRKYKIRKSKSETTAKWFGGPIKKFSKSEHGICFPPNLGYDNTKVYIEKNMGDTQAIDSYFYKPNNSRANESNIGGMEALQVFMKTKNSDNKYSLQRNVDLSAKSIFMGTNHSNVEPSENIYGN